MLRISLLLMVLFSNVATAEEARIATWNLGGFNTIPQSNLENFIAGLKPLDADIIERTVPPSCGQTQLVPLGHGTP